jgi:hypothetical protein
MKRYVLALVAAVVVLAAGAGSAAASGGPGDNQGTSSGTSVLQDGSSASADGGTNAVFVDQGNANEGDVTATGGDGGDGDADASVDQENEVEDVTQNADGGVAINALNPNVAVVLGGGDGGPAEPCEKSRCDGSSGTEIHQGGSSASADGGTNEVFVEQENANEGDVTATGGDGSGSAHPCKAQKKDSCNSSGGDGGGDADASVEQENEVEDVTQNANGGWAVNVLNPNVALVVPHDPGSKGCTKDANRCGGGHASGTDVRQGGSSANADGGTNVLVIGQQNQNKGDVTATGGSGSGSGKACKKSKAAAKADRCAMRPGQSGGEADADVEQENEVEDVTQNANGGWAINLLNPNVAFVGPVHRPAPSMAKY